MTNKTVTVTYPPDLTAVQCETSVARLKLGFLNMVGIPAIPASQQEFADLLADYGEGVSQQSVANWEAGANHPRTRMLTRLKLVTAGSTHPRTKLINEWASGILEGAE